jgi:CelD/BcsL family acetyltransferase involved in cellulose biosynthesis
MIHSDDGHVDRPQKPSSRPIKNDLHFEIITDAERLFSLKPHWDELCRRSADYNFSQSFPWCSTAWNIMARPQRRRLYCLVGWVGDRMVLIWPFVIQRRGLWTMLRPLGPETTEYSDVLVEDSPEADNWVALAWQTLRTTRNSDVIFLPFVRADSRLHRIISKDHPGSTWAGSTSSVSWDGYQDWESYHQSRNQRLRRNLRSDRRHLAERGNLSFELVTKHEEFPPVINWLFSHKNEWLARTKQCAPWHDAGLYQKFLISVAAEPGEVGSVTPFVLKLNGRIISAVLARISRFSVEPFIATFDRAYGRLSLGQLLYEDILEWAFKQRLAFDFRMGDQPYKKYWTNRASKVITYRFANSSWGATFFLASRCRAGLRRLSTKIIPNTYLSGKIRH